MALCLHREANMTRDEAEQFRPIVVRDLATKEERVSILAKTISDSQAELAIVRVELEQVRGYLEQIDRILGTSSEQIGNPDDAFPEPPPPAREPDLRTISKTQAVLSIVRQSGKNGVLPREITSALKRHGVEATDNYVYSILCRETDKRLVRQDGRYWAKEERNGR